MSTYTLWTSHLQEINPKPFKLQKEIQSLVVGDLEMHFGLGFVSTVSTLKEWRIETLAYNSLSKYFR